MCKRGGLAGAAPMGLCRKAEWALLLHRAPRVLQRFDRARDARATQCFSGLPNAAVSVRWNVAHARISCDELPISDSNARASATHACFVSSQHASAARSSVSVIVAAINRE